MTLSRLLSPSLLCVSLSFAVGLNMNLHALDSLTQEGVDVESLGVQGEDGAPSQPKKSKDSNSITDNILNLFSSSTNPSRQVPTANSEVILSYAPVVEKVMPAVVNIYASKIVKQKLKSPLMNDEFFTHFFGLDGMNIGMPDRVQQSLGSGVIVRRDGLIITNLHVIQNAIEIRVQTADRKEYKARVVVRDKRTDLAALKIITDQTETFPAIPLKSADRLKVGDLVLAIGNPFGLGHSVSSGIVSGLARSQFGVSDFRSFIQTDATINPGNSGGALVSMNGELIGINTAIFTQSGGSIGINFATPSNLVAPLIASADQDGTDSVIRPWVGAVMSNVTRELAESLGLDRPGGVIVKSVFPDSPADLAGLEKGDVILKIGNFETINKSNYFFRIAITPVGTILPLTILRKGTEQVLKVTLKSPPTAQEKPIVLKARHVLNGATVAKLSPALANDLGMPFQGEGVIVLAIRNGSPAARGGFLRPGDIILEINDVEITSGTQLESLLSKRIRDMKIRIQRGKEKLAFRVKW